MDDTAKRLDEIRARSERFKQFPGALHATSGRDILHLLDHIDRLKRALAVAQGRLTVTSQYCDRTQREIAKIMTGDPKP